MPSRKKSLVGVVAMGSKKLPGLRAVLSRRLVNDVIFDVNTSKYLLNIA
jgi:DNA-binding transcriptional regulator LsrR (DeoR family)